MILVLFMREFMAFEQIGVGLQLSAIVAIVVGVYVGPLLYVMCKDKQRGVFAQVVEWYTRWS